MIRFRLFFAALLIAVAAIAASPVRARAQEAAPAAHPAGAEASHEAAESTADSWKPVIAKAVNFALLVGILGYFLRAPLMAYLDGRIGKVREDLVSAAQTRETAVRALAEIDAKLKALPGEIEALKHRGAEDLIAERARIEQDAQAERAADARADPPRDRDAAECRQARAARARRQPGRQRRVGADPHHDYGRRSGAPGRSLRLAAPGSAPVTAGAAANRYARALFDVVLKEGNDAAVEKVQGELQQFADLFANDQLAHVLGNPAIPVSKKKALATALVARAGQISAPLAKLIVILAEKDRLTLLPGMARAYAERVDGSPEDHPR